jgi:hypothetical protein
LHMRLRRETRSVAPASVFKNTSTSLRARPRSSDTASLPQTSLDAPSASWLKLVNERCARAALAPNESVQQPRALLVVRTDGGVGRSASRLASRCSLGCSPLAQSAISSRVHKRQQAVERESRHVDAPSEGVYSLNLQAPSWLSSKMVPKRGRCGSSAVEG